MRFLIGLAALLTAFVSPANAQPRSSFEAEMLERLVYTETFDKPARRAFGGIVTTGIAGPWTIAIDGGGLSYSNLTDSSALRYVSLDSVLFGGARTPTDGTNPSALVKIEETQNGGAGLLAGYTGGGDYVVFALSSRNQYAIMEKAEGKLSQLTNAETDAITPGEFNALSLTQDDQGHFAFSINGRLVFEIDRPKLKRAPVGFAVYGKGRYLFGKYQIQPAPSLLDVLQQQAGLCDLGAIPPEDAVVVASVHGAAALSSVSVVGQDAQTHALTLDVRPGSQPIYVIALQNRDPIIWQFSGATDRIAKMLVIRERGVSVGVAGIGKDRVEFRMPDRCFWHIDDPKYHQAAYVTASLAVGRPLASLVTDSGVSAISIPDGAIADQQTGGVTRGLPDHADTALLQEAMRFDPAGVIRMAAADVVSDVKVEPYEVLPGQWGLLQLVSEGKIVPQSRDPKDGRMRFRIVAPMRFPAGLAGSQQVVFLLPRDVPMPAGNPGHSPVIPLDEWAPWSSLPG
jgi:hypothetical protein